MNLVLIGYGKMGKAVEKTAIQRGHTIVGKINSREEIMLLKQLKDEKKVDVAVEFTNSYDVMSNIMWCVDWKIPVVVGTTGWESEHWLIEKHARSHNGTYLYASNFSIGMNIFFELNRKLAQLMNKRMDYSPCITEVHHTQKGDAPSGTAKTLGYDMIEHIDRLNDWLLVNHPSKITPEYNLPIMARREGDVPGTHTIEYVSEQDTIRIEHQAHNREGFALGAVLACEFMKDKKKGVFTMADVLNDTL